MPRPPSIQLDENLRRLAEACAALRGQTLFEFVGGLVQREVDLVMARVVKVPMGEPDVGCPVNAVDGGSDVGPCAPAEPDPDGELALEKARRALDGRDRMRQIIRDAQGGG